MDSSDAALGEVKLWLYGDVNYDGVVNANDAMQIQRHLNYQASIFGTSDSATEADRLAAGNVVGDTLDVGDVMQILRYANYQTSVFNTLD